MHRRSYETSFLRLQHDGSKLSGLRRRHQAWWPFLRNVSRMRFFQLRDGRKKYNKIKYSIRMTIFITEDSVKISRSHFSSFIDDSCPNKKSSAARTRNDASRRQGAQRKVVPWRVIQRADLSRCVKRMPSSSSVPTESSISAILSSRHSLTAQ